MRKWFKTVRHDSMSLFQSLAEDVAERFDKDQGAASHERGTTAGKRPNAKHPVVVSAEKIASLREAKKRFPQKIKKIDGVSDSALDCAKLAAQLLDARIRGRRKRAEKLENELKFSTCDPKWIEAVTEYAEFFGKNKKIPYIRYKAMNDFVLNTLPKNARVGLLGDWGTGTDEAVEILKQMKARKVDLVLHVGDIYYSGTPKECQQYFLDILNQVLGRKSSKIPVYTLTGNHDMYSGGTGYYGLLPKLNPQPTFRAEQAQPASYFSLRVPGGKWQLLGLDTGLHDHDPFTVSTNVTFLDPEEEKWHVDKVRSWSGRTILFSHHQLFSRFDSVGKDAKVPLVINPKLQASYEKMRAAGDVAAWFWGHEHNLDIYKPFVGLDRGRCIGHSAVPVFVDSEPYKPIQGGGKLPELVDDPSHPGRKVMLPTDGATYAHGFVILELNDDDGTARASYYHEKSPTTAMYTETF